MKNATYSRFSAFPVFSNFAKLAYFPKTPYRAKVVIFSVEHTPRGGFLVVSRKDTILRDYVIVATYPQGPAGIPDLGIVGTVEQISQRESRQRLHEARIRHPDAVLYARCINQELDDPKPLEEPDGKEEDNEGGEGVQASATDGQADP
jgi:hypothetical protein